LQGQNCSIINTAICCSRSRGKMTLRFQTIRVKIQSERKWGVKSQMGFKVGARTQLAHNLIPHNDNTKEFCTFSCVIWLIQYRFSKNVIFTILLSLYLLLWEVPILICSKKKPPLSCVVAKKGLTCDKESNDSVGWYCSQLTRNLLVVRFLAQIYYIWIGNDTKFLLFLTIEETFLGRISNVVNLWYAGMQCQ